MGWVGRNACGRDDQHPYAFFPTRRLFELKKLHYFFACGTRVSHMLIRYSTTENYPQGHDFRFSFGVEGGTPGFMHAEDKLHHHAVPIASLFDFCTIEL